MSDVGAGVGLIAARGLGLKRCAVVTIVNTEGLTSCFFICGRFVPTVIAGLFEGKAGVFKVAGVIGIKV